MGLAVPAIKERFPILGREINGHRLVYLDSASSSQKPRSVLDAMGRFQETSYANVHRGVYTIGAEVGPGPRVGDEIDRLGDVLGEHDATLRGRVDETGDRPAGGLVGLRGLGRDRVHAAVHVGVGGLLEAAHGVEHRPWLLR